MRERKLTEAQVAEIKSLARTPIKKIEIARKFGISPQLVSTILKYGYTARPTYARRLKARDEPTGWETIAREYNAQNADDEITGTEAKAIHDLALKKILKYWQSQGISEQDLV